MLCKCSLLKDASSILALWFKTIIYSLTLQYILLRHYTCSDFCQTSNHLLISSPPTNLPNTLKIYTGEMKFTARVECGPSIHAFFQLKTFPIPRKIIPKNFSSLGFAVLEELGNKQTNTQTHSLTDWRFYRVIYKVYLFSKV